jgi:hypothetical protein
MDIRKVIFKKNNFLLGEDNPISQGVTNKKCKDDA